MHFVNKEYLFLDGDDDSVLEKLATANTENLRNIIGDYKYGYADNELLNGCENRLYLHAFCISFNDMQNNNKTVIAEFDSKFKEVAQKFGFNLPSKAIFLD